MVFRWLSCTFGVVNAALFSMILYGFHAPEDTAKWLVYLSSDDDGERYVDAVQAAVSLGRLDPVSATLTVIAIVLGLGALFTFGYIRDKSEKIAKEEAGKETRAR